MTPMSSGTDKAVGVGVPAKGTWCNWPVAGRAMTSTAAGTGHGRRQTQLEDRGADGVKALPLLLAAEAQA